MNLVTIPTFHPYFYTLSLLFLFVIKGAPKKEIIMSRNNLASLMSLEGHLDKAEANLRQSVEEAKALFDER